MIGCEQVCKQAYGWWSVMDGLIGVVPFSCKSKHNYKTGQDFVQTRIFRSAGKDRGAALSADVTGLAGVIPAQLGQRISRDWPRVGQQLYFYTKPFHPRKTSYCNWTNYTLNTN